MRVLRRLAPVCAATVLVTGGCSAAPGPDRELTEVEEAIIERMAEATSDDMPPEETEAARAEFVAECMGEEDLKYLGPPEGPSLIEWLGLTEEGFRSEYGFGHSTTVELALAYERSTTTVMEEYQASFAAMSAAERERYQTLEPECLQKSYAEFGFPENGMVVMPDDSPVRGYTERAQEATSNDPRLAEVTDAWSECMREQGFDFADRDEMGLPLQQEAEEFVTAFTRAQADAGPAWDDLRVADVLDPERLAALEDLQQREMAIAAAHQQCLDRGHDIEAAFAGIYKEHLSEFAGS